MMLALQVLGVLAAWCALSLPLGVLVGRGLSRRDDADRVTEPLVAPRPVDEVAPA